MKKDILTTNQTAELELFWKTIYKKYFNLDINTSIIEDRPGKRVIFIAEELRIQQVFDALPFKKHTYVDSDLDIAVGHNTRTPNNDYVVYVVQDIEVDKKFENHSAHSMTRNGITLLERLLLELCYFEETGDNMAMGKHWLCSGSCFGAGVIPIVQRGLGGGILLSYYGASCFYTTVGSIEVVS